MVDFTALLPPIPGIPYAYRLQLQGASWRGLPFKVESAEVKRGRRVAIHAYPYSEKDVWVEDLGLGTRLVSMSGLLIGDFVALESKAFIAAMEKFGPGELVHPTLGSMTVSVVDYSVLEEATSGRVVRFRAQFIQTLLSMPGPAAASPVKSNATDAKAASSEARTASQQDAKAGVAA